MNIPRIMGVVKTFTIDNSPQILTGVAVAGTIATAVLTAKAAIKTDRVMDEYNRGLAEGRRANLLDDYTVKDRIDMMNVHGLWYEWIPPVAASMFTVGCIIGANRIGTKRAAAVAAAFAIAEQGWSEYKSNVVERLGTDGERDIRQHIAQRKVDDSPPSSEIVIATGKVLFCDMHTMRYFESTMEDLKAAQNKINYQINNDSYASLSDWYHEIGLSVTSTSDEVGWSGERMLEIEIHPLMTEDKRPALGVEFQLQPVRKYYRFH